MDVLGWLIFLVALLLSLMVHETGHFVAAKRFGMKATDYFLGIGPKLWSIKRGETEYGIRAFPVMGYVKIVGMTSLDEVAPEDEPRSMRRAPRWQRLIVMAVGPLTHFVLALLLIFGLALGVGIENANTTQLGTVAACVPANEQALNNDAACTSSDPKSPALLAGLKVGDQVTSVDGVKTGTWDQLTTALKDAKPGQTVAVTVLRDGKTLTLHPTLAGVKGHAGAYLGVAATIVFQHASPLGAIDYAGSGFAQVVTGTVDAVRQIPAATRNLFAKDRSQAPGGDVISLYGAADATGQAVAANVGWEYKATFVLLLIASLNIFWGLLNLLPLLPMDGGHIAVVLWEMLRAWFARLRGRPGPGLADYRKLVPVMVPVFAVLVVVSVLFILADIVNPVNFG